MQISKSLKRLIYWELGIPLHFINDRNLSRTHADDLPCRRHSPVFLCTPRLLSGTYSAWRDQCGCADFFFAVAFGHATIAFYFKKRTA